MLEIKDLKKGEVYKAVFKDHPNFNSLFVFTHLSLQNKPGLDGKRLYVNQLKYEHGNPGDWAIDTYTISFELPSLEEFHWFLECEKAGKFIPKDEAMKSFNNIPEYVECIKIDYNLEIGKIYKIESYDNGKKYGIPVYFINKKPYYTTYFKPSTKEAYEAQFKQEEFKVGDWVTANGKDHTKNNPNFPLNQAFRIEKFTANGDKKNYYVYVDQKVSKILGRSTNVHDLRKAKLEEIPTDKLTDDELLELAKEHYPIGTTFKGSYGYDCNKELPVTMHKANYCGIYSGNSYIYHKNHGWAKIVSQPEPKVQKFVEPFNAYYGDFKQEWTDYTQLEVLKVEEQNSNEINIPKVVKSVKRLDLNIEKPTFAEIKIPIQEKPRKVIKPIILEKFQLTI